MPVEQILEASMHVVINEKGLFLQEFCVSMAIAQTEEERLWWTELELNARNLIRE